MSVHIQERQNGKVLVVEVSGRLDREDYERFVPVAERLIQQHGKIRVLFEMTDFHGWDAGALWEDLKFDLKHFGDIERLAMVGQTRWQEGMSVFCKPFTTAEIRYVEPDRRDEALAWVEGD